MEIRILGSTGMAVSSIALGTVELGLDYGFRGSSHYRRPDTGDAVRLVRKAIDRGITLIDTAPGYGDAERIIGIALADLVSKPLLASKVTIPEGDGIHEAVTASVESSLRTLGVETIDLLQIHNATVEVLRREEVAAVMDALCRAGKVRFCGASVYGSEASDIALANAWVRTIQAPYNLLDQDLAERVFPRAGARGCGVLTRSAFLRGVLTPRLHDTPAELDRVRRAAAELFAAVNIPLADSARFALRFCLSNPHVSSVIVGIRSEQELEASIAAAESARLEPAMLALIRGYSKSADPMVSPLAWTGLI